MHIFWISKHKTLKGNEVQMVDDMFPMVKIRIIGKQLKQTHNTYKNVQILQWKNEYELLPMIL